MHQRCPRLGSQSADTGEALATIAGTVVAQFGAPLDVTLDELRIELIYPADGQARRFFEDG